MQTKIEQDEIQSFLADSSNMAGGHATRVVIPENSDEVAAAGALAAGDVLEIGRGEIFANADGRLSVPLGGGRSIEARLPSYTMPATRKHAAGYFVSPGMDLIDLFIGSEGTLGVIAEAEVSLL